MYPHLQPMKQLILGNSTLEAGKYSLYTIPSKNEWTIIVIKILRCMGQQVMMKKKDVFVLLFQLKNG
jgi:membrane protein DedA with SNARE-associated domain